MYEIIVYNMFVIWIDIDVLFVMVVNLILIVYFDVLLEV